MCTRSILINNLPRTTKITVTLTRVLLSFGQDGKKKKSTNVCHINSNMVVINKGLSRYIRQLRCIDTFVSKIYILTIIYFFYKKRSYLLIFKFRKYHFIRKKYHLLFIKIILIFCFTLYCKK